MTPDRLILTPQGEQALLSAEAGGVVIRPRFFAVGDYQGSEPAQTPDALLGTEHHSGRIHYIEVLNRNTVRFTVVVPREVGGSSTIELSEATIGLNDGTVLGRVRFSESVTKRKNRAAQIEFLLHLVQGNAHVIDVTLSEFGSVPSVGNVDALPNPAEAITNAVAVLDIVVNPDEQNSETAGLAVRGGLAGKHWSFLGFTKLFMGNPTEVTDPSIFKVDSLIADYGLVEDDIVVVQIVSGPGEGATRRCVITAAEEVMTRDLAFLELDTSSTVSIWKQNTVQGSGSGLPSRAGTDEDWVLVAGPQDGVPRWVPSSAAASRTRGNLYHPPGKLKFSAITQVVMEETNKFLLYSEDPLTAGVDETQMRLYSYRKNSHYWYLSISGVRQFRQSANIEDNILEFAENVPAGLEIDARLFQLEPHSGMYTECVSFEDIGDGSRREFDLPADIENVFYSWCFIDRIMTVHSSYTIDVIRRKVIFSEAPGVGMKIEINAFTQRPIPGYSTQVITATFYPTTKRNVLSLPIAPQSKDLVFLSESGAHVMKSEFSIVGNKLVARTDFATGRPLEVMIFHNVRAEGSSDTGLRGMVTDIIPTPTGYKVVRQNADPIFLPAVPIDIIPGPGMLVEGEFPNFKISSTDKVRLDKGNYQRISSRQRAEDTNEVVITQRVEFKTDIMINVHADFSARLGPGYTAASGNEELQFILAVKRPSETTVDYGRSIPGTGETGITTQRGGENSYGYGNGSKGSSLILLKENYPDGVVDIVAKAKVTNVVAGQFTISLVAELTGIVVPLP